MGSRHETWGNYLYPEASIRLGTHMRVLLVSLAAFLLSSCTPADKERADESARQAGREMKREADRAAQAVKHGVEEFDRKAGPKLDQAGREIKEEGHRAAEKVRERTDSIQRKDRSDEPPPPPQR